MSPAASTPQELPDPSDRHTPDTPIRKKRRRDQQPTATGGPNLADLTLPFWIACAVYGFALAPLLRGVPSTESAGPGWTHLFWLPAGLAALLGAQPRAFLARHWILFAMALAAWVHSFSAPDGFEARRVALVVSTSCLAFLAGTALDRAGRERVIRSLAGLPWALAVAVLWHWSDGGTDARGALATPAGNRSDLAEFAWPGLVCGLAVFLQAPRKTSALIAGLGALGVAILFGAGPVYTGAVALAATAGWLLVIGWRRAESARFGRVVLIATAVAALSVVLRSTLSSSEAGPEDGSAPVASLAADREQGLAVRLEIWRAAWGMTQAYPWSPAWTSGVGPGQFAREYPRFRSPRERELSSHEGRIQNPVDVEHAHQDFANVLTEWGWVWSAFALLMVLAIAWAGVRTIASGDTDRLAPAAIWLGILVWGLGNAPLTAPVASHALAWAAAGMLTRPEEAFFHRRGQRWPWYRALTGHWWWATLVMLLAALQAPRAVDLVRHGRALVHASLDANDRAGERAIRQALAIQPDSPFALDLWAHYGVGLKDSQLQAFADLARIRPHQRGMWNDWGARLARLGRFDEAGEKFAQALAVDPQFAPALRNRVAALEDLGDRQTLTSALAEAVQRGAFERERLLPRAQFLLTQGLPELAAVYAQLHNPELNFTDPDLCFAQSQAAQAAGEEEAERAYRIGAQQGFARDHAENGDWESALRNYRLALRSARSASDRGLAPLALRLEMAAALDRSGRSEAARDELLGLSYSGLSARLRNHAPKWVVDTLPSIMEP